MKGVESSLGTHEAAVNVADDAMSDEDDDQCDILPPTKKYKRSKLTFSIGIRDIRTRDWKHNYCTDNVCYAITEKLCGTVANHWFG